MSSSMDPRSAAQPRGRRRSCGQRSGESGLHSLANEKIAANPPAVLKSSSMASTKPVRIASRAWSSSEGFALGVLGGVFRGPAQVAHGRAQVAIRRVGLGKARVGEIERRAIVRLQHEQAQGAGLQAFANVLKAAGSCPGFDIFSELMRSMPECIQ